MVGHTIWLKSVTIGTYKENGMKTKVIRQDRLTGECWLVQMWGTSRCKDCEAFGTEDCGGQEILKTGKNEKGYKVGEDGL